MVHWASPTINASRMAKAMYGSDPAAANPANPAATNRLSMATGPTDRCREVPQIP